MQSSFIVLFIKFMKLCFENIELCVIFFVVIFCQNNSQFNEIYEIINVFDEINFPKWSKIFDTKICKLNKIFFAWGKSRHVFFVFSIQKQRNFLRCGQMVPAVHWCWCYLMVIGFTIAEVLSRFQYIRIRFKAAPPKVQWWS